MRGKQEVWVSPSCHEAVVETIRAVVGPVDLPEYNRLKIRKWFLPKAYWGCQRLPGSSERIKGNIRCNCLFL